MVNRTSDLTDIVIDHYEDKVRTATTLNVDIPDIPEINALGDWHTHVTPNGLHISFEGHFDLEGAGHHQDGYVEFLERADDPRFTDFLEDLDSSGFTTPAVAVAVDVSRPQLSKRGHGVDEENR